MRTIKGRHVRATLAIVVLAAVGGGGGGSGSTRPSGPGQKVLEEVRRDGTCVTHDDAPTYCATDSPDAITAGGVSASGPSDNNVPVPTRTAPRPTATFFATASAAGTTPTAAGTPTPAASGGESS